MSVDLSMLIGDKAYKKARIANELELYYDAHKDLLKKKHLTEDSLQWWIPRKRPVPSPIHGCSRLSNYSMH